MIMITWASNKTTKEKITDFRRRMSGLDFITGVERKMSNGDRTPQRGPSNITITLKML